MQQGFQTGRPQVRHLPLVGAFPQVANLHDLMGQTMALGQEQQLDLGQVLGADLVLKIEWMVPGMGQPEGLVEEGGLDQFGLVDGGGQQGRVQVMPLQAGQQGFGQLLRQDQAQLRILALEGHQQQGDEVGAEGGDGADAQGAVQRVLMGAGDPLDGLHLLLQQAGMVKDGLADGGDLDRAVGALEQDHPQFLLQFLDLAAQGRLADEAVLGGLAEVAGIGNGQDVLDVAQIHRALAFSLSPGGRLKDNQIPGGFPLLLS